MAKTFTVVTCRPEKNSKYIYLYNNSKKGGKSLCINGSPTDSVCNVLCNCVGWACGRFNHIYNEITGYTGIRYPNFCCNAENFIEVAQKYGLKVSQIPQPGAIMVWQKGATLKGSDGAGHVAIVEKVNSASSIMTSESGYGSFCFANKTRSNSNGNWGLSSPYKFRGFIYNPAVEEQAIPEPVKKACPVSRNESVNQIQIISAQLNVRTDASTSSCSLGFATRGYYNYTETKICGGYTWYKIADKNWVAYNKSWITILPKKVVTPTPAVLTADFKVGDLVSMAAGAPIYGKTSKFATWVYQKPLYIRAIVGSCITISTQKSGAVTGKVDKKYLTKK